MHSQTQGEAHPAQRRAVAITVNGQRHEVDVDPRQHLGDFLRQQLQLTGTHLGCEHGVCGACTVIVDGVPVRSCLMLALQADGAEVTTVEGLADKSGALHPVQAAFRAQHGLQCGFCTPGMLTTLVAFLADNANPTEIEIREAISGNLCRCTGYQTIVEAAQSAAKTMRGES